MPDRVFPVLRRVEHLAYVSREVLDVATEHPVMFDASYTRRLVALGYEDARSQESELAEFFSD